MLIIMFKLEAYLATYQTFQLTFTCSKSPIETVNSFVQVNQFAAFHQVSIIFQYIYIRCLLKVAKCDTA